MYVLTTAFCRETFLAMNGLRHGNSTCWSVLLAVRPARRPGRDLAISPRTVEVHRARIMEKLGAKNAADLMRIVLGKGIGHRAMAVSARQSPS